ncbi:MAG: TIGR03086 family metal-binding protein [Nocardioidaceae bacterium]
MTASTPTSSLVGGFGLLERATSYTLGSLQLVTSADLLRPTPCRDWDLRTLFRHMNDSLATLHEAAETGYVDLADLPADSGLDDLVGSLKDRACQLLGEWSGSRLRAISIADLTLSSGLVAATGALEVAVHGWDVSAACGTPRKIPSELAGELLELALILVTEEDRPGRFAHPVRIPAGSSPSTRLLAWLGRDATRPPWQATT